MLDLKFARIRTRGIGDTRESATAPTSALTATMARSRSPPSASAALATKASMCSVMTFRAAVSARPTSDTSAATAQPLSRASR